MKLNHLAIIPDGNRRWARQRGLPTLEGHRHGYKKIKHIGEWCLQRGIVHLTIWGFSTENWKRSEEEVSYLMDLIFLALTKEIDFYQERGIRLRVFGNIKELPSRIQKAVTEAEEKTKDGKNGQLNICLNYGGRAEIIEGIKNLLAKGYRPEDITEEMVTQALWTGDLPSPDLIIRTSGEQRLSGFMSWLGGYSELLFLEKHFPDFEEEDLDAALREFES